MTRPPDDGRLPVRYFLALQEMRAALIAVAGRPRRAERERIGAEFDRIAEQLNAIARELRNARPRRIR